MSRQATSDSGSRDHSGYSRTAIRAAWSTRGHTTRRRSSKVLTFRVGGALSGIQFVSSNAGCRVINVDQGSDQQRWELALRLDEFSIRRLNRVFGTDVEHRGSTLEERLAFRVRTLTASSPSRRSSTFLLSKSRR
jgi:hypothetical protein